MYTFWLWARIKIMWWEIQLFVICVFVECPVYMHFADTQSRRWSNNTYYCFGATDKCSTKGVKSVSTRYLFAQDETIRNITFKSRCLICENMTKVQPSDVRSHQSEIVSWLDWSVSRVCSNTTPVLYNNVLKFGIVFVCQCWWWCFHVLDRWHRFLDVSLPVVVNGGMTSLFYVEPILFAYCKNVGKSSTSIPQPYICALKD